VGVVGTAETGKTYRVVARPYGDGPFRYRWSTGETSRSITLTTGPVGTIQRFTLAVTDTVEHVTRRASLTVTAKAPPAPPKPKPDDTTLCERFPWKCENP
jgi:hypothetical protein